MSKTRRPYARPMGCLLAAAILTGMLAACSPGGLFSGNMMYAPHRSAVREADALQSALTALSEGDRTGQIRLSESELASLLNLALAGETDADRLIRDVQVWLEPDTVYLKLVLREGVIRAIPGEIAVNVEAKLSTVDGRLILRVQRAGLGVLPLLTPATLNQIETQLQAQVSALIDRSTPLSITVEPGVMVIDLP